ncbi:unnamed protein product, partial [Amoebophrya sp. A25]
DRPGHLQTSPIPNADAQNSDPPNSEAPNPDVRTLRRQALTLPLRVTCERLQNPDTHAKPCDSFTCL